MYLRGFCVDTILKRRIFNFYFIIFCKQSSHTKKIVSYFTIKKIVFYYFLAMSKLLFGHHC